MREQQGCSERCWTAIRCPECGNTLGPRGRSLPLEMLAGACCEDARMDPAVNPQHLWDEHDSTRHYVDPEGWAAHCETCDQCTADY